MYPLLIQVMFTVVFFFTPSGKVVGDGDDIQERPVPTGSPLSERINQARGPK